MASFVAARSPVFVRATPTGARQTARLVVCRGVALRRTRCSSGDGVGSPNGDGAISPLNTDTPCLVLVRHGESLWNQRNLFTGCVDVPLSERGINEALDAGRRISEVPVDAIFTSDLIRAQMTACIIMTQHRLSKVPVVIHDSDKKAVDWSRIFSKRTMDTTVPMIKAWELNERMYGELQGLNKQETVDRYGADQVKLWRRSYDVPPPNGESLEMTAARAVAYFTSNVQPLLDAGKSVMIAAHGNSLRSIIMHIEKLTPEEVVLLELFTAVPSCYEYDQRTKNFISRGTPAPPDVQGVYAISAGLARYKDVLDTLAPGYSS